ncbi:MAG: amino acid permease, partial [Halioglobus sp.]|nr:amino acid permease [Halioglobus sp.]
MGPRSIGLTSLVALVIGNMLGAGVFTTSGFALGDLGSPAWVMLAWLLGGLLALCGALSYGALARLMPESGGEYLFLSRAVHPLAGFVAGWISLWAGFTAAIAFAAITFEAYLLPRELADVLPRNTLASAAILVAALAHGVRVRYGAVFQNSAVALKLALIAGFILFGLWSAGRGQWAGIDIWLHSEEPPLALPAFAMTLMWISFSYSGFNASVYVAGEVAGARRMVPKAMLYGTAATTVVYLLLNFIFVFAPAPEAVAQQEDVAAVAAQALGGDTLAGAMRGVIAIALFTSISAMIMAGPRVYAQMAADGMMPARLVFRGAVPRSAIALQAALAMLVVWLSDLRELLSYLGFTLGLSSAATVAALFVAARGHDGRDTRLPGYPWAPAVYVGCTLLFCALAATINPWEMLAALLTIASALAVYAVLRRGRYGIQPPAVTPLSNQDAPLVAPGSHSGPIPCIRMGDVSACMVNGVFGDPLLQLQLLHQRRNLLFDLGDPGRLSARAAHQVTDLFLTHAHADHIGGFLWFLRTRIGVPEACRLYGPPGIARQVAGLVDGILWDRVEERAPRFEIREWRDGRLHLFEVVAGHGGAIETGQEDAVDGIVWREAAFQVRATELDHGTPVLAYAFEPRARLNVCRDRLQALGLATGPWLQELKREYLAGNHDYEVALPDGRRMSVEQLRE